MSCSSSAEVVRGIVQRSANLNHLHFRLLPSDDLGAQRVPSTLLRTLPSEPSLLSLATNLTIHGYRFEYGESYLDSVSLPALKALAVVSCRREDLLFIGLSAIRMPDLHAIMVKGCPMYSTSALEHFVASVASLRELVLHGESFAFDDGGSIMQHADTLELLSVRRKRSDLEYSPLSRTPQTPDTILRSLTAVRHFSIYLLGTTLVGPRGDIVLFSEDLDKMLVSWWSNRRQSTTFS